MFSKFSTSSANPCFIRERRDALVFQNNPDFRVGVASRAHHKFGFKFGPPWILASKAKLAFVLQFGPFFFDFCFVGTFVFCTIHKGDKESESHIKFFYIQKISVINKGQNLVSQKEQLSITF